jgi:rhomboid family protein
MIYRGNFGGRASFGGGFKYKSAVLQLLIINVAVYLLCIVLNLASKEALVGFQKFFAVVPNLIFHKLRLWQLVTYMFLHSLSPMHIFFNMLVLFFLGRNVESSIGKTGFLKLYFASGIGAALIHIATSPSSPYPMLGASGAVFGVIMAFAMISPEKPVTLIIMLVFPMTVKAKYLALGLAVLQLLFIQSGDSGVAYWAHLGGMFFGYLFMKVKYRLPLPWRMPWAPRFQIKVNNPKPKQSKYQPVDAEAFISEEVDPILEKISRHGMKSLTRKERQILKKAHSHMKDVDPK